MSDKCEACRYSCKSEENSKCKFYPKEQFLGNELHFNYPNSHLNHDSTMRMCVACKGHFNYTNIRWKKEKEGLYPFCVECFKTALFIDNALING